MAEPPQGTSCLASRAGGVCGVWTPGIPRAARTKVHRLRNDLRGRVEPGDAGVQEDEALIKCISCSRGEMVEERRPWVVERHGRVAAVRDVPVLVCDGCGEVYLDAEVNKQLDVRFRRLLDGPVDHLVGYFEQAVS